MSMRCCHIDLILAYSCHLLDFHLTSWWLILGTSLAPACLEREIILTSAWHPLWLHLAWRWSWWNSWNPNVPNLMASWQHTTSPNSKPWQLKKSINSKIPYRASPNIKEPKIWIVSVAVKLANAKNFKIRYIQNSGFPSGAMFKASPKNENAENIRNLVTGKIKNDENLRNRHIQKSDSPRGPP